MPGRHRPASRCGEGLAGEMGQSTKEVGGPAASSLLKNLAWLLICISSDICEDILIRYLHKTFNSNFVGLVTLGRYIWIFMIKYLIGNILNIFKYLQKKSLDIFAKIFIIGTCSILRHFKLFRFLEKISSTMLLTCFKYLC